jgi:hypothetical protein
MSYIEKKFFREGQNETPSQIDLYKNRSNGELVYRDPNGIEIVVSPQGGLESIINIVNNLEPKYKVYTALLTQSGGIIVNYLNSGSLVKGVSYTVTTATSNCDFTNVGGPSGVSGAGLSFVATENLEPNNWDGSELEYNEGAPVVTVLENTIGDIWFTYLGIGLYQIFSDNLFTLDKSWGTAYSGGDDEASFNGFVVSPNGNNELRLNSGNGNNDHISIRLEIRVYN